MTGVWCCFLQMDLPDAMMRMQGLHGVDCYGQAVCRLGFDLWLNKFDCSQEGLPEIIFVGTLNLWSVRQLLRLIAIRC